MELKKTIIGVGLCFLIQGVAIAESFMDEVRAIRAKSKTANIEIHDITAKYIPIGTRKEDAINFCEVNKFKIYTVDKRDFDTKKYDEAPYCDLDMTKWYLLGFGDVVRISMRIKNDVVVDVKGFIFYQAW